MIKIVETKELRQAFEYAHDTLGPIAAFRVVTELIERDLNQAVWDPHDVVSFGW